MYIFHIFIKLSVILTVLQVRHKQSILKHIAQFLTALVLSVHSKTAWNLDFICLGQCFIKFDILIQDRSQSYYNILNVINEKNSAIS